MWIYDLLIWTKWNKNRNRSTPKSYQKGSGKSTTINAKGKKRKSKSNKDGGEYKKSAGTQKNEINKDKDEGENAMEEEDKVPTFLFTNGDYFYKCVHIK